MDKEQVLSYLQRQIEKIDDKGFDLELWKSSTISFLDLALGPKNMYSRQIKAFDYEIKVSVDELYPKKIPDVPKTKQKLKGLTQGIIEQIDVLGQDVFQAASAHKGEETLHIVVESLKNSFTGLQLKSLREIADIKDAEEKKESMLSTIKQYDVDTLQHVLADILGCREIWKEIP